jgi:hypothetical protein
MYDGNVVPRVGRPTDVWNRRLIGEGLTVGFTKLF